MAIGVEPAENGLGIANIPERPFDQVLCNAFMASASCHPFWEDVFKVLVGQHLEPYPILTTGPHMLTWAYESFPEPERILLIEPDLIYPTAWNEVWSPDHAARVLERTGVEPMAVHHWMGTWRNKPGSNGRSVGRLIKQAAKTVLRKGEVLILNPWGYSLSMKDATQDYPLLPNVIKRRHLVTHTHQPLLPIALPTESNQIAFAQLHSGQPLLRSILNEAHALQTIQEADDLAVVSAILFTDGTLPSAQRAVAAFQAQRYPHKELVIVATQALDDAAATLLRE